MSELKYEQFVLQKVKAAQALGFEVAKINGGLFHWQNKLVRWALKVGRAALFEDCGLGKTIQQLEWAWKVAQHTKKPVLILAPLAVASQTKNEGEKFGIPVNHCRELEDFDHAGINITNYDRLDIFESIVKDLGGVVLDESSILKAFTGKTRIKLTEAFGSTPYRLCCTATPSPNDYTELGQHAEFLGVCSSAQMLSTWFVNDTFNTGDWRLKKHATEDFWRWVSTWAACVSKPSDIGGDDEGFILPDLNMETVTVAVHHASEKGSETLFVDATTSATSIHKEMRRTCNERCNAVARMVNASSESWIVWCNTNDESDLLKELIPDAVEVKGSDKAEHKEEKLSSFTLGHKRVIITKASIAGYGLNWQHCNNVAFASLSYSFEDWYQAVRRSYRFGQTKEVNCYLFQADTENNILPILRRKMSQHETMREAVKFTAANLNSGKTSTHMKIDINTVNGDGWTMHHGDCVRSIQSMPDDSIGFSIFSPPFADLFTFSNDIQDMGNCESIKDFMMQFDYLVEQLARVLMPGREVAVYCADLLSTKWRHGNIEFQDFSGELIRAFRKHGFLNHSRITIWKDPVLEMQRTKAHGLLYKTLRKDSSSSRVGAPEYLLVFRKPGDNPVPIEHTSETLPLTVWQELASPVWMTVNQSRVLDYDEARGEKDEKHICPLQLDVIERALRLWSAKGDLVLSPFAGIGSEGYCALKMDRKFVGCELKDTYFDRACHNLKMAVESKRDLFTLAQ